MQEKSSSRHNAPALQRIAQIREKILAVDYVCSGTVVTSMNTCGKPNCRCATDPSARHGPYHQWNRMRRGKLLHTTVSATQAAEVKAAISNYRKILRLLRSWETETAALLGVRYRPK